jgi:uncharacterized membrane protein YoaK (UPF0700 family)
MTGNAVVLVVAVIASTAGVQGSPVRLLLIGLLGLAMGGQNAVVRRLSVPDLTTTVLTLTVTGLVADTTPQSVRGRRVVSVLAMLAGALIGGVLLRWVALAAALWLAQYFWPPALRPPSRQPAGHKSQT